MGTRATILLVSLAVNVTLAFTLVQSRSPSSPGTAAGMEANAGARGPRKGIQMVPRSPGSAPSETVAPKEDSPTFHWSQIESDDYKEYIAHLRAFGTPERTIRDIIIADVEKLYRARMAALRVPTTQTRTNYWERYSWGLHQRGTKEQRAQLRALEKEQTELVKELLGKNVYTEMQKEAAAGNDWLTQQFGELPPEQQEKVTEMQQRYWEQMSDLQASANGYFDEEMQEDQKALRRKLKEELAGVLTPEQLKDYELRTSDTAQNMRWQLRTFDPNEAEFRAIHDYKQGMEEWNGSRVIAGRTSTVSQQREEQRKQLDEQLAQVLSPERVKELKLNENYEFQNLFESGTPKEAVFKVADMKSEVEAASRKLRNDQSLSAEERTAALAAIRAETERTLTELLGERRSRAYVGNAGYWLRNIAPRP